MNHYQYQLGPIFKKLSTHPDLSPSFKEYIKQFNQQGFENYQAALQQHIQFWQDELISILGFTLAFSAKPQLFLACRVDLRGSKYLVLWLFLSNLNSALSINHHLDQAEYLLCLLPLVQTAQRWLPLG